MQRFSCLVVLLTTAFLVSTASLSAQIVVAPSGYATLGGPAYPYPPASAPLLVTPIATFATLADSPVGARNATANLQTGATNATISNIPGPSAASFSVPQFQNEESPREAEEAAAQFYAVPQPVFDRGVSRSYSAYGRYLPQLQSLGQVARAYRSQPKPASIRTYTNEDIEHLPSIGPAQLRQTPQQPTPAPSQQPE